MGAEEAIGEFCREPTVLELRGAVQHYEWGGYDFIPRLLGEANPARRPYAELWIGAHPKAPSRALVGGEEVRLDALAASAGRQLLGRDVSRFSGALPYLFKVLDARGMLSIQVHPSKERAAAGFARENAAGIPIDAPERNYRDPNHKPEAQVALADVWMLHGFRPLEEIAKTLRRVPGFSSLMPDYDRRLSAAGADEPARQRLLRDLYRAVMKSPQAAIDRILDPLVARLQEEPAIDKASPEFWALRAARSFPLPGGHRDRGIVSLFLLNLVRLQPGQGTFQPPGTPHAYLEGVNVEVMANSDNVLRGGLTPKHVDTEELLETLEFRSGQPEILGGREVSGTERLYDTPAEEFSLGRIEVSAGRPHEAGGGHGAECMIVMEGAAEVSAGDARLAFARGGIALVPAELAFSVKARGGPAVLFTAAVPAPR